MKTLFKRYRPTRTADGQGGFTEALGAAVNMWGAFEVDDPETRLAGVDAHEDALVGDIVDVNANDASLDADYYRVTGIKRTPGGMVKSLEIERTEKPVSECD